MAGGAAAGEAVAATTPAVGDEVKPYRIHVSSRYLDLTRQKLELTRLPHENAEPRSDDWWEPKPQVEPLIDYWLEKYSWRDQESSLNKLPQFRTSIPIASSQVPLRIHFLHARSPHAHAVPLLLIPPFPFSSLSLGHLIQPFTDPEDAAADGGGSQPFHLVIPSLPGLGFSDAFPNNTPAVPATAEVLNTLMTRLSYPHYLATNAGPASASPAEIDWRLAHYLATRYPSSCLGTHLISPPLASPRIHEDPWEWTKWSVASFFRAGILGYSDDDFSALEQASGVSTPSTAVPAGSGVSAATKRRPVTPAQFGLNELRLREPNTLAYALCDSPTGLLVFVLKGLRLVGPRMNFSPEQIITITELAWLPGPENAMRFWAHCALHRDEDEDDDAWRKKQKAIGGAAAVAKPRVAISVFVGGKNGTGSGGGGVFSAPATEEYPQTALPAPERGERYACPAWGNTRYDVVFSQRSAGKPGLLAWERPDVILAGVRGLAREVRRVDERLKPIAEPAVAPLERVVVAAEGSSAATPSRQQQPQSQSQPQPSQEALLKRPEPVYLKPGEGSTPKQFPTTSPALMETIAEESTSRKGPEQQQQQEQEQKEEREQLERGRDPEHQKTTNTGDGEGGETKGGGGGGGPSTEGESPDTLVVSSQEQSPDTTAVPSPPLGSTP